MNNNIHFTIILNRMIKGLVYIWQVKTIANCSSFTLVRSNRS